jgi:hypothetical protein
VDLRAGLDDLEKRKFFTLPGFELRPLVQVEVVYRSLYIIYNSHTVKVLGDLLAQSIHISFY